MCGHCLEFCFNVRCCPGAERKTRGYVVEVLLQFRHNLFSDFLGINTTHLNEGYLVLLDVVHKLDYLCVICPVLRVQWDPDALGQI